MLPSRHILIADFILKDILDHRDRLISWKRRPGVALCRLERIICREFPGITDDELVAALTILREALERQIDHKTLH